jgi:propionyl-CoA carboxylase alpha chain
MSAEEAISSFGDGRLLVEKYIQEPRHIEFQILGDKMGNYVYLPERECSVQRRNQKVIEEAPCAIMDEITRDRMGTQACNMARHCGYYTTGTCEFLMDKKKDFYFLEMNTRLQVEHPITEEITGIDLVEEMIKIAAGHKLEFGQKDIKIDGHSIEYRIYAEDPSRKFLPSIGFLRKYVEPVTKKDVRIDTGVNEGSEISMYYDPMISKLIVWGKDRDEAIDKLNLGIDEYVIRGVSHNSGFCKAIINNEQFRKGNYTTAFIPTFFPTGYTGETMTVSDHKLLSIMAHKMRHIINKRFQLKNVKYRERNANLNPLYTLIDDVYYKVTENFETGEYTVEEDGAAHTSTVYDKVKMDSFNMHKDSLIKSTLTGKDGKQIDETLQYVKLTGFDHYHFFHRGTNVSIEVLDDKQRQLRSFMPPPLKIDYSKMIVSPMPGNVVSLTVKEGDTVVDGQEVCVIEAMKMQNIIRSETDAVVKKVHCKLNQPVVVDETLIEFE